jgi:uncharacterized membrane-anchored protein
MDAAGTKIMKTRVLILLGALLVLGAANFSIMGKERIKRDGEIVLLVLAPVDPRSLMQGDYMTLRFDIAQTLQARKTQDAREGEIKFASLKLDANRVASLAASGEPATTKFRYRIRKGSVWLGTNAFFFEEGSAGRFEPARYGEFRLDQGSGEAVLVGLRDANFKPL